MKSGVPAEGTWTTPLMLSSAGAVRVQMPLAGRWLTLCTALLIVRVIGLVIGLPLLALYYFVPHVAQVLRFYGLAAVVIGAIAGMWIWYQLPRARVYRMASGHRWLHFVGVHPIFISAMNRSRLARPTVFSPDGLWYWDGAQWTSNNLPGGWWRRYLTGLERLRRWQITLIVLLVWVVIAAIAWIRFHS